MGRGRLIISLDFELHWGVRDKRSVEAYRKNLLGVRDAVPAMLSLFERYDVHATWATVGFLFCEGKSDLLRYMPERKPGYQKSKLSPYAALEALGESEDEDPYHFAPSLIARIAKSKGQEIGTHSFSHYYCLEPGQDLEDFKADLTAAKQISIDKIGAAPTSIVFPRNQFNPRYLGVCEALGIRAYRGNLDRWIFEARNEEDESQLRRGVRLLDHYLPITGDNSYEKSTSAALCDVPASRFLRPFNRRLRRADPARLRRIHSDMQSAAERGSSYHLWWHPHNFGMHLGENLEFLNKVLTHFEVLRRRYDMQSVTMSEAA